MEYIIASANKKDAAKKHEEQLSQIPKEDLVIYTDGSGCNDHIRAAIYCPTTNATRGQYIGTKDSHNVYGAELIAIQMALTFFKERMEEYANVHIFADSQSAIQAVESPKRQSGQYIIKKIMDTVDRIYEAKPRTNIHIDWVPGHTGINGNEWADQAAKAEAINASSCNTIIVTTQPKMKSAQKSSIQWWHLTDGKLNGHQAKQMQNAYKTWANTQSSLLEWNYTTSSWNKNMQYGSQDYEQAIVTWMNTFIALTLSKPPNVNVAWKKKQ